MTYEALARGATGLFYFAFDAGWKMREHPETWAALTNVVREINERLPLFNLVRENASPANERRHLASGKSPVQQAAFMPWGLLPISHTPSMPYDLPVSNE